MTTTAPNLPRARFLDGTPVRLWGTAVSSGRPVSGHAPQFVPYRYGASLPRLRPLVPAGE